MALGPSLAIAVFGIILVVMLIGFLKDALGALRKPKIQVQDSEELQILKKRLTRGEICIEEYKALRDQIKNKTG